MKDAAESVRAFLDRESPRQEAFLAELVKVPSDNPPGDCAPHAERAAALLEGLGFAVERHPVPQDIVRANGTVSATNLVVRHRFGEGGPVVALNAHGDAVPPSEGWTRDPYGAEVVDGWMAGRRHRALRSAPHHRPRRGGHRRHAALDEHGAGRDAALLACFGDDGLDVPKELAPVPMVGMAEAACHAPACSAAASPS